MVLLGLAAKALKRNFGDNKPAVAPMAQGAMRQVKPETRYAKGGKAGKDSPAMMKKEIAFMKKKGAPKSMVKHEEAEAKGMRKGGMACGGMKKYAAGGPTSVPPSKPSKGDEKLKQLELQRKQEEMDKKMQDAAKRFQRSKENDSPGYKSGGSIKKYAKGGGIESKGKTKGRMC